MMSSSTKTTEKKVQIGDRFQKDVRFAIIDGKSTEQNGIIPSSKSRFTHVQFRRFAGCPVCNYHLRSFIKQKEILEKKGIEEIIIFHSTSKEIQKYENDLPFSIIADPKKDLYKSFGLESNFLKMFSWKSLQHFPKVASTYFKALRTGERKMVSFMPTGGQFGMPGDLLLDQRGSVIATNYGKNLNDQWSIEDLYKLIEKAQ